jgi:DNA helicase-2/ATP-dependent DNA helicase PcrA
VDTAESFAAAIGVVLGRPLNDRQRDCVQHVPDPLMIVAGPGTGKTTVLVLRALRHVFVDRILPEHILITTFTKKAAKEIASRLVEWGGILIDAARASQESTPEYLAFLTQVDINRFVAGTLDSICEDVVAEARTIDQRPPVVIEPFAANQWLSRYGNIWEVKERGGLNLSAFLAPYASGGAPASLGDTTAAIRIFADRFVQDRVDLNAFQTPPNLAEKRAIVEIFTNYRARLDEENRLDFSGLEERVLNGIEAGAAPPMLSNVRAVLVDEYQDTNPLQEALYFALIRSTNAALTVVGDDDQSLYRFRGATMELFRSFAARAEDACGRTVRVILLADNYRSVPEVATFFNDFVVTDGEFVPARVQPKGPINALRLSQGLPVLGMFRVTTEALARDLSGFLADIFRGNGWTDPRNPEFRIECDDLGDFGDAVFLAHSTKEFNNGDRYQNGSATQLLPGLLRNELAQIGVGVFNPSGQKLKHVPEVERILGLVLISLNHENSIEADPNSRITGDARRAFGRWRNSAAEFLRTDPRDAKNERLQARVDRWRAVARNGEDPALRNVSEWPALDVIYSFLPWLNPFQDDPEHQVYLEAISRCAAVAATFSRFSASIVRSPQWRAISISLLIRDILQPIGDDLVDVDEDVLPSVPRDRLNFMTIHQAKGLEFPLVVVDVGMYSMNSAANQFRRFPSEPSSTTRLEDDLAHCTEIGPERQDRTALDRSFDDLVRLYYVAYSRPRSVLLLVGHGKALAYQNAPRNLATWWRRNGTWAWRDERFVEQYLPTPPARRARGAVIPPIADSLPFYLVEEAP